MSDGSEVSLLEIVSLDTRSNLDTGTEYCHVF